MTKIAFDAGHGINTPGKRTPDGEREWSFNDAVVRAAIARLGAYERVSILRVDDTSGKTDIPLRSRTNRANAWKADVYVSVHHNANVGVWGSHGGVETFVNNHPQANPASQRIADIIHPRIVKAMGLRDRGVKKANLHVVRETNMPAILTEGGFMDSTTDIGALRSAARLKAQGEAITDGLAQYFGLKLKAGNAVTAPSAKEVDEMAQLLPQTQKDDMRNLLAKAYKNKTFSTDHTTKVNTMTRGQALDLLISYVARTAK